MKKPDTVEKREQQKKSKIAIRKERQKNRGGDSVADWASPDAELLQTLIAGVTVHGGTITFGYTRDGGAYFVNFYVDGESIKEYIRPTEDIDAFLAIEIEGWKF